MPWKLPFVTLPPAAFNFFLTNLLTFPLLFFPVVSENYSNHVNFCVFSQSCKEIEAKSITVTVTESLCIRFGSSEQVRSCHRIKSRAGSFILHCFRE